MDAKKRPKKLPAVFLGFVPQDGKHLCSLGQSPHQVIYNLYNVIALTEIKGYAMIQFSYMIMRLYGQGNFTTGKYSILPKQFTKKLSTHPLFRI